MSQASEEKRIKREKALRDNLRKRKEKAKELKHDDTAQYKDADKNS